MSGRKAVHRLMRHRWHETAVPGNRVHARSVGRRWGWPQRRPIILPERWWVECVDWRDGPWWTAGHACDGTPTDGCRNFSSWREAFDYADRMARAER